MVQNSDSGENLTRELPSVFPRDDESGNYKLFQVVGHELDEIKNDIDAVDRASTVQHADTIGQIERLGKLVQCTPRENESREKYRSRVIGKYQLVTSEGAIRDILNSVAVILDIETERVGYEEFDQDFTFSVKVPSDSLDNIDLNESELATIIEDLAAASANVQSQVKGTFKYISPATYQSIQDGSDSWDNYDGYDGLDSDGNKKNNPDAGTYAGTLN